MSRARTFLFLLLTLAASRAGAQEPAAIDPGMSRADVVSRLGRPLNERSAGGYTYLFYRNGCERTCGMNDLVILENDRVVDAIFRSPARTYTGTSTSPNDVQPAPTAGGEASALRTVRRAGRGGLIIASPAEGDSAPPVGAAPPSATPAAAPVAPPATPRRPVLPVPIPGAYVNPADSVRALSPDRPTAIPGARVNPADSIRAEQVRRQQQDTTRPPR